MTLKKIPGASGTVHTIDEDIEALEHMVESGVIDHMIQVVLESPIAAIQAGTIHNVHVYALGTPIVMVRDMLQVAIDTIDELLGHNGDKP